MAHFLYIPSYRAVGGRRHLHNVQSELQSGCHCPVAALLLPPHHVVAVVYVNHCIKVNTVEVMFLDGPSTKN